jgi:iron-sulfur cluster repair protein YtfE (RIC family)
MTVVVAPAAGEVQAIDREEETMPQGTVQHAESSSSPVTLVLERHHRRLDEMLDRVEMDVEVGSWSEARRRFAQFQTEMDEHIRLEEELMFPAFEAFARATGGPTAVMRVEHREIQGLIGLLEQLLRDEQPIADVSTALESLLGAHNAKEERVLYPLFERHAAPSVYAALDLELRPLIGQSK